MFGMANAVLITTKHIDFSEQIVSAETERSSATAEKLANIAD